VSPEAQGIVSQSLATQTPKSVSQRSPYKHVASLEHARVQPPASHVPPVPQSASVEHPFVQRLSAQT
jgi:hypothetical protein